MRLLRSALISGDDAGKGAQLNMAKAQTNPQPQVQVPQQVPQQPVGLDYRQFYAQQHGQPGVMPYGAPQQIAYNPYYRNSFFRNPLTGGQWLLIIGGAVMIGGLAYYGWVRWKQSKAATAAQQPPATNPSHVVRHLRPHAGYPYGRAA